MKRSEIIKIICDHINDNVSYYYKNGVTFQEHEAEYLLDTLAKAGMEPPFNKKNWRDGGDGNEWDPE
jgi:hypothetical protein